MDDECACVRARLLLRIVVCVCVALLMIIVVVVGGDDVAVMCSPNNASYSYIRHTKQIHINIKSTEFIYLCLRFTIQFKIKQFQFSK